ncbi:MAG: T9SS type A sorting domain-containing protein [Cyclobacteriaceae bacterium]
MKDLDHYFNKAKEEREIISLEEIRAALPGRQRTAQSQSRPLLHMLFRRKELRFAAVGVFILLLGCMLIVSVLRDEDLDHEVFVPPAQRRVMHLVKNVSARPENEQIKVSQFGSDANPEATGIPIHLRSKFELSDEQLELLGIRFYDDYIRYEGNVAGSGYLSFGVLRAGAKWPPDVYPLEVSDGPRAGVKEYQFYPWFMTDEAGYQGFRYRFNNEPALKTSSKFFLNVIDELIPIQIDRPSFKKVIFWFSQTPELMDILESAAKMTERPEITEDRSTTETRTTVGIEIFPTITKGGVQVVANILKKQKLEIAILNSSGEILQIPVNNQLLEKGHHTFSMDLSTFRKGLYFVRIKSDPGLITIHRLFKE